MTTRATHSANHEALLVQSQERTLFNEIELAGCKTLGSPQEIALTAPARITGVRNDLRFLTSANVIYDSRSSERRGAFSVQNN